MTGQEPAEDAKRALKRAIWDSNEVLVTASTAFLTVPRGILTLNRIKLVAEKRSLFRTADVMSVRIEDVLNVNGTVGPIFGSVTISTKFTDPSTPYSIGPFWRKDVLQLKRIIQGYIIALQRKIDVNPLPTEELITMLYKLGEDDHSIQ
ncbi:MAG TPA: hypothetical protein VMR75_02555 [Candidatus Saccharimonadales bacterium]|nr:hypothetical protein [Candidatus Saccharimonadales bacterium]